MQGHEYNIQGHHPDGLKTYVKMTAEVDFTHHFNYTKSMPTRDDYIGQNNPAIFKYATDNNLIPDDVLDSPMIQEEDLKDLANTAFANPYARTYPCHTKAACVNSALWDAATHPGNELVTANIKKMAAAQGIQAEVDNIYNHFAEAFTKAAAANEPQVKEAAYALTLTKEDGTEDHFFNITEAQDTIRSAEEADRQYRAGNIADPYFRKIASSLVGAAAEQGVPQEELPRSVRAFGTTRVPDPYMAELAVRDFCKRSNVAPEPYVQEVLALQAIMEKAAAMDEAINGASYIADKMCELNLSNGILPGVEDSPYSLIFQGPTMDEFMKYAGSTVYIMDVPVPAEEVINIPATTIDTQFAPQAGQMIHAAQAKLQEETADAMDKVAAAAEALSKLSPGAARQLLWVLSQQ